MAGHKHGSMDPTPNERTFEAFLKIAAGVVVGVLVILVFLAIVGT